MRGALLLPLEHGNGNIQAQFSLQTTRGTAGMHWQNLQGSQKAPRPLRAERSGCLHGHSGFPTAEVRDSTACSLARTAPSSAPPQLRDPKKDRDKEVTDGLPTRSPGATKCVASAAKGAVGLREHSTSPSTWACSIQHKSDGLSAAPRGRKHPRQGGFHAGQHRGRFW